KSRTNKLLVPCTIGLFVFHFIQGYLNMSLSIAEELKVPPAIKYLIMVLSGQGVLWYIQMLWLFSMALLLIRKIEKDRLWHICTKTSLPVLILLSLLFFGAGQVGNTPIICVYRFGLYFVAFLLGYFVFSHDEVINILKKYFWILLVIALALGIAFCIIYFGKNYGDKPVNRTPLFLFYGYFGSLAMLGGFAKYFDFETKITKWMNAHSFGLYIFHYLGISVVAYFIAAPKLLPPVAVYALSLVSAFTFGYVLFEIISRIPFFRWAVLGIKKNKKKEE
nr:acyltransferase [Lachnospiraceae bacterium]